MCIDGNVMTVLSNGPCSRRSHCTDQKCSTNRAAESDGAHRWRSNTDALADLPTTPRMGAGVLLKALSELVEADVVRAVFVTVDLPLNGVDPDSRITGCS